MYYLDCSCIVRGTSVRVISLARAIRSFHSKIPTHAITLAKINELDTRNDTTGPPAQCRVEYINKMTREFHDIFPLSTRLG
jgi:hypothetical protein